MVEQKKGFWKRFFKFMLYVCIIACVFLVYYANNLKKYTVTFVVDGKETTQQVVVNNQAVAPNYLKKGYTFLGWETEDGKIWNSFEGVRRNVKVTATYMINVYNARFYAGTDGKFKNENSEQPISIEYNAKINFPEVIRTGYDVEYWETIAGEKVELDSTYRFTRDETFTAVWTKKTSKINFNANGGSCSSSTPTKVTYGESYDFTQYTATRTGYEFNGWEIDNGYSMKGVWEYDTNGKTVNLKAKWEAKKTTVSFNSDGGSTVENKEFTYDEKLKTEDLPTPTKEDYTFCGWELSGTKLKVGDTWKKADDTVTLTAKWIKTERTITLAQTGKCYDLVPEGTDIVSATATATFTATYNLEKSGYVFVIEDPVNKTFVDGGTKYSFIGWFDGNGEQWKNGDKKSMTDDVTLIAKWSVSKYTFGSSDLPLFASMLSKMKNLSEIVLPEGVSINTLIVDVTLPKNDYRSNRQRNNRC